MCETATCLPHLACRNGLSLIAPYFHLTTGFVAGRGDTGDEVDARVEPGCGFVNMPAVECGEYMI